MALRIEDYALIRYHVMNTVNWKPPLDLELYARVRAAFAVEFLGVDRRSRDVRRCA